MQPSLDLSTKPQTFEELAEPPNPKGAFEVLDATLREAQDWQAQSAALSVLRSLLKFSSELFEDNTYVTSVFRQTLDFAASSRPAVAKAAVLAVQEASQRQVPALQKLCGVAVGQLFSRLSDASSHLTPDVEKALDALYQATAVSKLLSCLFQSVDSKSPAIRLQVARGVSKVIQRLQKDFFQLKESDRVLKTVAALGRDASAEVRSQAKDTIKQLLDLSDQPELLQKQLAPAQPSFQASAKFADVATAELERNTRIRLKRLKSNKPSTLNRTEELAKEIAPMPLLSQKPLLRSELGFKEAPDAEDPAQQKPQFPQVQRNDLMIRSRKAAQSGRFYPELECMPALIADLESEGRPS